jgi:hypothetical protein
MDNKQRATEGTWASRNGPPGGLGQTIPECRRRGGRRWASMAEPAEPSEPVEPAQPNAPGAYGRPSLAGTDTLTSTATSTHTPSRPPSSPSSSTSALLWRAWSPESRCSLSVRLPWQPASSGWWSRSPRLHQSGGTSGHSLGCGTTTHHRRHFARKSSMARSTGAFSRPCSALGS